MARGPLNDANGESGLVWPGGGWVRYAGSDRVGSCRVGLGVAGSGPARSGRMWSGRFEFDRVGSGRVRSVEWSVKLRI